MKRIAPAHFPVMRKQDLVIEELPDEVLVYDRECHQAHCLNLTAAMVWKNCDGRTTPREIASRLEKQLQSPCPEDLVWLALRELEGLNLLEQPIVVPAQLAAMSRRQLVRTLSIAAVVAIPVISSLVSPTPAEAASCTPPGGACPSVLGCCLNSVCNAGACT